MLQTLREKPIVRKVVLWSVLLVMVLGLGAGVTFVFSDLLGGSGGGMAADAPWALRLGTQTVTPAEFQQELRLVAMEAGRMGLPSGPEFQTRVRIETMQRLVRRSLELQEARKAGLSVSDRELEQAIVSMPDLQRDGRFIGRDEYQRILQREGYDVVSFEERIRNALLCEKWEALVTAGAVVTEREIDDEMAHRGQKVKFDYVVVSPDKFAPATPPTDAEVKSWYDAHPDRYQRGEARRAQYVVMETKTTEPQIPAPTDEELRKAYEADAARLGGTFETRKDEVRSQVIYSKALTETDRKAAVFKAGVASQEAFGPAASKAGLTVADTGLVRPEDATVAALGAEFLNALFTATPGGPAVQARVAGGSAVLVVTETRPAARASLDEARSDIVSDLKSDKARQAAMSAARLAVGAAGGDLGAVAGKLGVTVQSSPLVGKGEPVPSLGVEPAVEEAAFSAAQGAIAAPVATAGGSVVVLKVVEKPSSQSGAAAAGREQVRSDLRRNREVALLNSILESAYKKTELKTNEDYIRQFGS